MESWKYEWYKNGWYIFPPPPVYTFYWDDLSWIKYIDACGKWIKL